MSRCDGAAWLPLPETFTQARIEPRLVIVHSAGGTGSVRGGFGPSDLESHFWVGLGGRIEQYIDTNVRADANYHANSFAISIETENHPGFDGRWQYWDEDPWSPEQVAAITSLCDWASRIHGIPRRLTPTWDGSGFGWHIMFGSPGAWTPINKACPGARRIQQFQQIVIPALSGGYTQGEPVTDADMLKIIAGVDAILKDDRNAADARVNAYVTNATNRAILEITGHASAKPNKEVPPWP